MNVVDDKTHTCAVSQLFVVWIQMETLQMFSFSLARQSSQKCFGVFTVGCGPVKRSLSHTVCISSAVLWRGQSTHSLQRPWSAGMPLLPLQHSMEAGISAFIHVINSVEPWVKAPHAFLYPQAQGWPALHRCGKQTYVTAAAYFHSRPLPCIIFRWGGRRN